MFPFESIAAAANLTHHVPPVVPVQPVGWSATTYGVWALVVVMTPVALALLKTWPSLKKLRNESDGSLRADLMKRLDKVERELIEERRSCDLRLAALQGKLDAVTRQFVQFQLTVVRYMPAEYAHQVQMAAHQLLEVIAQDVEEFAPAERPAPVQEDG